ncbi:MAG: TonB-dependent receptor [Flavobacteriales bacterium]|nr:TonB-dependent receptor [Flavobacteriales bacterium]
MRILVIILVLLLFGIHDGVAQTLKGTIKDSHTNETLPGVNIYLPELKKGVTTDVNGNYNLKLPRKGDYKIQISFVGYEIILQRIDVEQEELILDFDLHPTVIEAKEFVVSSVYHSSQDENPVDVIQFNTEQLQQSLQPTLMQSLSNVAGVNLVSTGIGIGKPVIRGLSFNRVLVFSEGVPIDNQQFGDEHGLGLSEIGIEKVEVIKGPSSLLYGADAMGGVLHFVDERPANINTIVGNVGTKYFSNTNGYQSNFGFKGTTDNFRYKLNGGRSSHGDYLQGNGERVTNTRFTESAIKANIGFMKKWWTNDVNYSFLQSAIGIPEGIGEQNTSRNLSAPFQVITNQIVSTQNTFHIKKSHIKLNLGYLTNNRTEFEEGELKEKLYHDIKDSAALDMLLQTSNYDLKWHLPEFKNVEIILGSQGKYQTNANRGEENLIPDAIVQQVGGFGIFKYAKNKLSVISGVRYDVKKMEGKKMGELAEEGYKPAFNKTYKSFNGSLGLTYKWNKELLTRFNIASGFRSPNLAELSSNGVHEGTFRYEIGNLQLETEQNIEFDLGAEYVGEHVSFAVSGFNNLINNYIYLTPTDSIIDTETVFSYIQSNANLYGFETTLDIHPHSMHWLHFETQFAMVIGKRSNGDYLPRIPAHNLLNTIKAELKDIKSVKNLFLSIESNTIFEQNNIDEFEMKTPAYVVLGAKIGGDIYLGNQPLIVSLGVTNLLNQKYYNHLSRLKPDGIYDMGTNFVVSLKVPFNIKK